MTRDFDIGIAPLLDTEFSRSKSPVKCLEYAARGIPVVANDAEPYRNFVKDGVTGYLIPQGRDDLWLKRLTELANDEDMRRKMGEAAREQAREWTIERHWPRWTEAYSKMFPDDWEYGQGLKGKS